MMDVTAGDIARFWLDEVGPKRWYAVDAALDAGIRERFLAIWEAAREGELAGWGEDPARSFGYLILTDQFPRNMFRGDERAFATDGLARQAAYVAIGRRWDLTAAEPQRQFFYLPLMHSESLRDQDRCVRLMIERLPKTGADNVRHARAHREIVRRFGRFPYRNAALRRMTLPSERVFLENDGYGGVLRELDKAAAAGR